MDCSEKKYENGLVIGKFMPVHKGHMELIDFALSHSRQVTIAVCSAPDEPIPVKQRLKWLNELYQNNSAIIIEEVDENLPRSKVHIPEISLIWNQYFAKHFDYVDAVFTSEKYGQDLADFMEIDHVVFDVQREQTPISGTEIRSNPLKNRHFLPEVVYKYFEEIERV